MLKNKAYQYWFITGSQPLYGQETIDQVAAHSDEIVKGSIICCQKNLF